jgi:hypothetical protein
MRFYIYENWQAGPHKAIVHRGDCGNCNEGLGKAGGYDLRHAKWQGPYDTLQEAEAVSAGLRGVELHNWCPCV